MAPSGSRRSLLIPRELIKALLKINLLRHPRVRNLDYAMDLQTKIHPIRIHIVLWIKATLALEVPLVNVESAGVLFQVQEIATVDADFVVEHQYAEPDFKG